MAWELVNNGYGEHHTLVSEAVQENESTVESEDAPIPDGTVLVHENVVYEATFEVVDSRPATTYSLVFEDVGSPGISGDGPSIRFPELPRVDREKLAARGLGEPPTSLGVVAPSLYTEPEQQSSVLVPEPEYRIVEWEDDTGRLRIVNQLSSPIKTRRYTVDEVAPSPAEYGQRTVDDYAFQLTGLSDEERRVVESAVDGREGYTVADGESIPDAVRSLVTQFRPREKVRQSSDDVSGTYLVRYEGSLYWTQLHLTDEFDSSTEG
ncbi:hypothetical protein [Haloarchaeobius litoreus]|uniref:Uncharacterized protein n=1 Tax=Haloarchaeobius litoreus TaxID=755306 RepID=A0ABD6DF57_9EURY|nr:hypothetical protein [Haloarchaeobius litoreus]